MADGHGDMEGWGVVYSIFKEAGRLLYQHFRILRPRPFIFAFLVPLALILFLEVIGIAGVLASMAWLSQLTQPHHVGGILGHYQRHHSGFQAFLSAFLKARILLQPKSYSFIIKLTFHTYTFTFLILFISWLFARLVASTIAKAIHHIYIQNASSATVFPIKNLSFFQTQTLIYSIYIAFFRFIYCILIVSLYFFIVDIFTYLILAIPFHLFSGPQLFPYSLETICTWFSYFVFLILDSWFEVSNQVAILKVY